MFTQGSNNVAFPYDTSAALLAMPVTEVAIVTATTSEAEEVAKEVLEMFSVVTERFRAYNSVVDNVEILYGFMVGTLSR
ncbi:hypothetical protein FIBSPDRAFT_847760 [Athelia psychrophila]|uniref:Uncharacterized protein n=1 Tax=Athelia psychrophila TaxID=1759441 RepID=A0A166VXN0_9AGAM|nr:hypothetical protein FIBSPDRAFT_847760 [Fibularhizoctonia sp. CBS 109695]